MRRAGCEQEGRESLCPGAGKRAGTYTNTVTTWGSTTNQVLALRAHLLEQKVTLVVMEATGVYWKPFYFLLEDGLEVILVNARQVATCRAVKPMSAMRGGWPNSARTV